MTEKRQMKIVTGGSDPSKKEPPKIKTKDEAVSYLEAALKLLEQKRHDCNVRIPHDRELEARVQRKAYAKYQIHLGRCLEAPGIFFSVGLLDASGYELFYGRAMATMAPTLTGSV